MFASAARAPLTSVASVVEMTGDYTLTLPVMLAVAIATASSRALSYGTIYTTKLLRRGYDIDRATPWRAVGDLTAADAMRPSGHRSPCPADLKARPAAGGAGSPPAARRRCRARSPTRVTGLLVPAASPAQPRTCRQKKIGEVPTDDERH